MDQNPLQHQQAVRWHSNIHTYILKSNQTRNLHLPPTLSSTQNHFSSPHVLAEAWRAAMVPAVAQSHTLQTNRLQKWM
jgi:hypothetical protein